MADDTLFGAVRAVNEALRHEFARLPITVKAVEDGNADRAAVVAGHVAFMCDWLDEHNGSLSDPAQVSSDGAQARTLAAAWTTNPGHQERASLHTALIALEREVLHQLASEDQRDVGSVDPSIVQAEATAAIGTVLGSMDADVRAVRIGLVVADASPANRLAFIAALPADARATFDAEGMARYEAYRARLTDY